MKMSASSDDRASERASEQARKHPSTIALHEPRKLLVEKNSNRFGCSIDLICTDQLPLLDRMTLLVAVGGHEIRPSGRLLNELRTTRERVQTIKPLTSSYIALN